MLLPTSFSSYLLIFCTFPFLSYLFSSFSVPVAASISFNFSLTLLSIISSISRWLKRLLLIFKSFPQVLEKQHSQWCLLCSTVKEGFLSVSGDSILVVSLVFSSLEETLASVVSAVALVTACLASSFPDSERSFTTVNEDFLFSSSACSGSWSDFTLLFWVFFFWNYDFNILFIWIKIFLLNASVWEEIMISVVLARHWY